MLGWRAGQQAAGAVGSHSGRRRNKRQAAARRKRVARAQRGCLTQAAGLDRGRVWGKGRGGRGAASAGAAWARGRTEQALVNSCLRLASTSTSTSTKAQGHKWIPKRIFKQARAEAHPTRCRGSASASPRSSPDVCCVLCVRWVRVALRVRCVRAVLLC